MLPSRESSLGTSVVVVIRRDGVARLVLVWHCLWRVGERSRGDVLGQTILEFAETTLPHAMLSSVAVSILQGQMPQQIGQPQIILR